MLLKPQDILVLLKLVAMGGDEWSYQRLAFSLHMSPAEVHAAIKRSLSARLAGRSENRARPRIRNLREFLVHGIQYVFIPERGAMTRGLPTGIFARPLSDMIVPSDELPYVWPDPEGSQRGLAFSPLYKSAPKAAREDSALYELLALVDALRSGNARERDMATAQLEKRLGRYGINSQS